jgi:hypothetical protein
LAEGLGTGEKAGRKIFMEESLQCASKPSVRSSWTIAVWILFLVPSFLERALPRFG